MSSGHPYEYFRILVTPALNSKLEELSLLGYGKIPESQLWSFLTQKKWKRPKDDIHLYEVIQEILSLKPGDFMNYQTVEAFKSAEFSFHNEEDWKELLK